jgi:putative ATP-dependent endonuclease of OLD family
MMHLTNKHTKTNELKDAFVIVKKVADEIFSSVREDIANTSLNVAFPGTELHFQFHADTKTDIYKNCVIYIDDGFKSLLTEKGAGIQSATLIGLFYFYTKEVNIKNSALLCVEEPELYLHPHARRVISDRLDDFIDDNKNQVILTTHSPEFIRTTDASLNIILTRKNNNGTTGMPLNIKNSKSLLLNNNHNEIFFADKVIICEGFDDYILRWVAAEKFPKQLDEKNISIITAGGKNNFEKFIKLILKLKISCYIFADFDYFLRDTSEEADKYREEIKDDKTNKVKRIISFRHMSIGDLGNDFFIQQGIFSTNGHNELEKIKTFRNAIKLEQEDKFYKAKRITDLENNQEIKEHLSYLRQNGVGILDCEIEDLSLDTNFLSTYNKLNLSKIFEISSKLVNGISISSIIDTAQIEEFLKHVLQNNN